MSSANPLTRDERERIYRLWCHGHDLAVIARRLRRHQSAVTLVVREAEAASDWRDWPDTGGRPRISSEDKVRVLDLAAKGLSQQKIAEKTGVSKSAVGRLLRQHTN